MKKKEKNFLSKKKKTNHTQLRIGMLHSILIFSKQISICIYICTQKSSNTYLGPKPSDSNNNHLDGLVLDHLDDKSNLLPIQNLFDKFPGHLARPGSSPQPLAALNALLRWFDHFQLLKYLALVTAFAYDVANQPPADG